MSIPNNTAKTKAEPEINRMALNIIPMATEKGLVLKPTSMTTIERIKKTTDIRRRFEPIFRN